MKHHILVGKLGTLDQYSYHANDDETLTVLDLVTTDLSLDHGIGRALSDLISQGVFPSEIGLDFLISGCTCASRRYQNF